VVGDEMQRAAGHYSENSIQKWLISDNDDKWKYASNLMKISPMKALYR
jgi:hypothetical protein